MKRNIKTPNSFEKIMKRRNGINIFTILYLIISFTKCSLLVEDKSDFLDALSAKLKGLENFIMSFRDRKTDRNNTKLQSDYGNVDQDDSKIDKSNGNPDHLISNIFSNVSRGNVQNSNKTEQVEFRVGTGSNGTQNSSKSLESNNQVKQNSDLKQTIEHELQPALDRNSESVIDSNANHAIKHNPEKTGNDFQKDSDQNSESKMKFDDTNRIKQDPLNGVSTITDRVILNNAKSPLQDTGSKNTTHFSNPEKQDELNRFNGSHEIGIVLDGDNSQNTIDSSQFQANLEIQKKHKKIEPENKLKIEHPNIINSENDGQKTDSDGTDHTFSVCGESLRRDHSFDSLQNKDLSQDQHRFSKSSEKNLVTKKGPSLASSGPSVVRLCPSQPKPARNGPERKSPFFNNPNNPLNDPILNKVIVNRRIRFGIEKQDKPNLTLTTINQPIININQIPGFPEGPGNNKQQNNTNQNRKNGIPNLKNRQTTCVPQNKIPSGKKEIPLSKRQFLPNNNDIPSSNKDLTCDRIEGAVSDVLVPSEECQHRFSKKAEKIEHGISKSNKTCVHTITNTDEACTHKTFPACVNTPNLGQAPNSNTDQLNRNAKSTLDVSKKALDNEIFPDVPINNPFPYLPLKNKTSSTLENRTQSMPQIHEPYEDKKINLCDHPKKYSLVKLEQLEPNNSTNIFKLGSITNLKSNINFENPIFLIQGKKGGGSDDLDALSDEGDNKEVNNQRNSETDRSNLTSDNPESLSQTDGNNNMEQRNPYRDSELLLEKNDQNSNSDVNNLSRKSVKAITEALHDQESTTLSLEKKKIEKKFSKPVSSLKNQYENFPESSVFEESGFKNQPVSPRLKANESQTSSTHQNLAISTSDSEQDSENESKTIQTPLNSLDGIKSSPGHGLHLKDQIKTEFNSSQSSSNLKFSAKNLSKMDLDSLKDPEDNKRDEIIDYPEKIREKKTNEKENEAAMTSEISGNKDQDLEIQQIKLENGSLKSEQTYFKLSQGGKRSDNNTLIAGNSPSSQESNHRIQVSTDVKDDHGDTNNENKVNVNHQNQVGSNNQNGVNLKGLSDVETNNIPSNASERGSTIIRSMSQSSNLNFSSQDHPDLVQLSHLSKKEDPLRNLIHDPIAFADSHEQVGSSKILNEYIKPEFDSDQTTKNASKLSHHQSDSSLIKNITSGETTQNVNGDQKGKVVKIADGFAIKKQTQVTISVKPVQIITTEDENNRKTCVVVDKCSNEGFSAPLESNAPQIRSILHETPKDNSQRLENSQPLLNRDQSKVGNVPTPILPAQNMVFPKISQFEKPANLPLLANTPKEQNLTSENENIYKSEHSSGEDLQSFFDAILGKKNSKTRKLDQVPDIQRFLQQSGRYRDNKTTRSNNSDESDSDNYSSSSFDEDTQNEVLNNILSHNQSPDTVNDQKNNTQKNSDVNGLVFNRQAESENEKQLLKKIKTVQDSIKNEMERNIVQGENKTSGLYLKFDPEKLPGIGKNSPSNAQNNQDIRVIKDIVPIQMPSRIDEGLPSSPHEISNRAKESGPLAENLCSPQILIRGTIAVHKIPEEYNTSANSGKSRKSAEDEPFISSNLENKTSTPQSDALLNRNLKNPGLAGNQNNIYKRISRNLLTMKPDRSFFMKFNPEEADPFSFFTNLLQKIQKRISRKSKKPEETIKDPLDDEELNQEIQKTIEKNPYAIKILENMTKIREPVFGMQLPPNMEYVDLTLPENAEKLNEKMANSPKMISNEELKKKFDHIEPDEITDGTLKMAKELTAFGFPLDLIEMMKSRHKKGDNDNMKQKNSKDEFLAAVGNDQSEFAEVLKSLAKKEDTPNTFDKKQERNSSAENIGNLNDKNTHEEKLHLNSHQKTEKDGRIGSSDYEGSKDEILNPKTDQKPRRCADLTSQLDGRSEDENSYPTSDHQRDKRFSMKNRNGILRSSQSDQQKSVINGNEINSNGLTLQKNDQEKEHGFGKSIADRSEDTSQITTPTLQDPDSGDRNQHLVIINEKNTELSLGKDDKDIKVKSNSKTFIETGDKPQKDVPQKDESEKNDSKKERSQKRGVPENNMKKRDTIETILEKSEHGSITKQNSQNPTDLSSDNEHNAASSKTNLQGLELAGSTNDTSKIPTNDDKSGLELVPSKVLKRQNVRKISSTDVSSPPRSSYLQKLSNSSQGTGLKPELLPVKEPKQDSPQKNHAATTMRTINKPLVIDSRNEYHPQIRTKKAQGNKLNTNVNNVGSTNVIILPKEQQPPIFVIPIMTDNLNTKKRPLMKGNKKNKPKKSNVTSQTHDIPTQRTFSEKSKEIQDHFGFEGAESSKKTANLEHLDKEKVQSNRNIVNPFPALCQKDNDNSKKPIKSPWSVEKEIEEDSSNEKGFNSTDSEDFVNLTGQNSDSEDFGISGKPHDENQKKIDHFEEKESKNMTLRATRDSLQNVKESQDPIKTLKNLDEYIGKKPVKDMADESKDEKEDEKQKREDRKKDAKQWKKEERKKFSGKDMKKQPHVFQASFQRDGEKIDEIPQKKIDTKKKLNKPINQKNVKNDDKNGEQTQNIQKQNRRLHEKRLENMSTSKIKSPQLLICEDCSNDTKYEGKIDRGLQINESGAGSNNPKDNVVEDSENSQKIDLSAENRNNSKDSVDKISQKEKNLGDIITDPKYNKKGFDKDSSKGNKSDEPIAQPENNLIKDKDYKKQQKRAPFNQLSTSLDQNTGSKSNKNINPPAFETNPFFLLSSDKDPKKFDQPEKYDVKNNETPSSHVLESNQINISTSQVPFLSENPFSKNQKISQEKKSDTQSSNSFNNLSQFIKEGTEINQDNNAAIKESPQNHKNNDISDLLADIVTEAVIQKNKVIKNDGSTNEKEDAETKKCLDCLIDIVKESDKIDKNNEFKFPHSDPLHLSSNLSSVVNEPISL